jgi:hypothetical protein
VLADLVRTDRHHHRPVAGDSAQAEAVKVLTRAHQSLIWAPPAPGQRAAQHAAGVLPGRAGCLWR